jgi:hypothetical protein
MVAAWTLPLKCGANVDRAAGDVQKASCSAPDRYMFSVTRCEEPAVVTVSIEGDRVRFEVEGWDKLWALRSQLEIPLEHIESVRVDPEPARGWWHGIKLPGSNIPGVLTAGTFYQHGGAVFYDVHDPERTIVLELNHEHYKRLVIEVDDPATTVARLQDALSRR